MPLKISDQHFKEILTETGAIMAGIDDLEIGAEEIKDLLILPALRTYFTWFPIRQEESYVVGSSFEIPFPSTMTFGVLDARFPKTVYGRTGNPFVDERMIQVSKIHGMYGTPNDYDTSDALITERAVASSKLNSAASNRIIVDENSRVVKGFASLSGSKLFVTWALWSEDFDAVPMRRLNDVIKLARAQVLKTLAMIRGQGGSDQGPELNADLFSERADKLEEEVLTTWKGFTKPVLIRS